MRVGWIIGISIWIGKAALAFSDSPYETAQRPSVRLDSFVAGVNGRIVTFGDVLLAAQREERDLMLKETGEELQGRLRDLYHRTREDLITRALILEEALIREAVVDERAVDGYMSQTLQNQFNNDRTQLLSALSRERMTIADYRKRLTDDLLVMMLRRQEVDDRTVVSPGAVRAAYDSRLDSYRQPEQVKLHVILLQRGESPEEQAAKRAQADLVVKRLASGDDFTAMAREVSEGPGASGGGEWEWTKTSEILPALRDRLAELEAGTCSGVIETGEWFFIARLDARRPETMIPFEDVRQNLERELKRAEEERIFRRWIAALEARHCVRRMTEPWMDSQ